MSADPNCIFCKIVAGQIPCKKVYEDEELLGFHDIHPWAPVHILLIPKQHIANLYDAQAEHNALFGRMLGLAPRLMRELGVENGFRTLINTGADGMQEVYHLHMHVMGGPRPWSKG
ncbi:MAG: histidine triad nucleotide-binding protein [Rubrivivax sp.]|nr:histidine triad nucleotide-binding protein [Rubrivivax sp.]